MGAVMPTAVNSTSITEENYSTVGRIKEDYNGTCCVKTMDKATC